MAEKPNLLPAGLFYLLNILGLLVFTILPALNKSSLKTAVILGGLYGLMTYSTYDLTNFATLKGWPVKVVLVDIAWGTLISATVSGIAYYIGTKIS